MLPSSVGRINATGKFIGDTQNIRRRYIPQTDLREDFNT